MSVDAASDVDSGSGESCKCFICGYDLVAAPEGVCPECGADAAGRAAARQRRGMIRTAIAVAVSVFVVGPPICLCGGVVWMYAAVALEEWGMQRQASGLVSGLPRSSNATANAYGGGRNTWANVDVGRWSMAMQAHGVNIRNPRMVVFYHVDTGHAARSFAFDTGGVVFKLGRDGELSELVGVPIETTRDIVENVDVIAEKIGALPLEELMEKWYQAEPGSGLRIRISPRRGQ